ncbi:MAG TPA: rhomboid family intramembrane serine protease, partial [Acidimicrobiales bacterium]
ACAVAYFFWQPSPFGDDVHDIVFSYERAAIPLEIRQREPLSNCQFGEAVFDASDASELCAAPDADLPAFPAKSVWLSLVTSLFLHGSLWHLGGTLLFLWVFGNNVEDRLGHVPFALFYLLGGTVATIGHMVTDPSSDVPVVGASGAIAAVMGAYLIWYPRARVFTLVMFFLPVRLQARWVLVVWFVLQFFTSPNSGVAWMAHVVGFLFGAAVGWFLRPRADPVTQW